MFRKMRREKNAMEQGAAQEILRTGTHGVLALAGDEGYPYGVPLSYVYEDDTIYFHCTSAGGHKTDALKNSDKASFCVVAEDRILPEKFSTHYQSAIAFGRIRFVTEQEEKQKGLELLVRKYSGGYMEKGKAYIRSDWDRVAVLALRVEHLTGKQTV